MQGMSRMFIDGVSNGFDDLVNLGESVLERVRFT